MGQNDESLISSVAVILAKALSLDGMNRTLVGRKIVRLAMLAGGNFDKFLENAADTCGVRSDILDDIFNSVVQKYKKCSSSS